MSDEVNLENAILLISDRYGIYIPKRFAKSFKFEELDLIGDFRSEYDAIQAGPDSEWYWESWDMILDHAVISGPNGKQYRLYQDGDLWAIPLEEVW